MLKLQFTQGRYAPAIYCDLCDERIQEAGNAAALFRMADVEGQFLDVAHVHKGACMVAAEAQWGGYQHTGWIALLDHLLYVVCNSGLTPAELCDRDDQIAGSDIF